MSDLLPSPMQKVLDMLQSISAKLEEQEKLVNSLSSEVLKINSAISIERRASTFLTPTNSITTGTRGSSNSCEVFSSDAVVTPAPTTTKVHLFEQDQSYHKQRWINSKNEDFKAMWWDADDQWVKAVEKHFPELSKLRSATYLLHLIHLIIHLFV